MWLSRKVDRRLAIGLVVMFLPAAAWAQYLYQEHYQWRNDDGSESSATWKANADTAMTGVTRGTNIRLRFAEVNKYTGTYAFPVTARLEYSTSTSGPWTPVSTASDGTTAFEMTTTSGYADGDSTTAQLAGAGTFVAGKCVESPNNTSGNIAINLSQYSNFEYCFKATAKAIGSATYYFRLAGFSYQSYTVYAQLKMAAGEANEPPKIVSPLAATGSVVAAFSYTIQATGSEPITYGATSLPSGVSFNGTNKIVGTPTTVGSYSVPLTATNAWGSATQTLALTVVDNQPPVAGNQTLSSLAQGCEVLVSLAWSDPDQPAFLAHTFSIVSGPSLGTLTSYFQRYASTNYPNYYYYKAGTSSVGNDTFTWKCNDGKADSNVGTVTVPVVANNPPVAINSGPVSVPSGQQGYCSFNYSHADSGQTLTFSIVGQPAHGSVSVPYPNSAYAYYTSASGFAGGDSFTWKCNDGKDDSNVATVTVTVTGNPPVPQNQMACAAKNTAVDIPAMYTGGGFTYALVKVSNPAHGSVVVTNDYKFHYVPAAGYAGEDSFTWKMTYSNATTPATNTVTVTCSIVIKDPSVYGNDWPMWRGDEQRTATTTQNLPGQLYLQWRHDYLPHAPAWTSYEASQYEKGYEPVVIGKTMILGSSRSDWVVALDTDTGVEKWRFYTDGPVRVAPVAAAGRVYVCSDDGNVYCLDTASGALLMKKFVGVSNRKCFGNQRMISVWPARGGPLLADGKAYFMSGVWTAEGTFAYCLDAATGAEVWMNDSFCGVRSYQPHSHVGPGGPPPMGYLVVSRDRSKLYIGTGNGMPASFDRATGGFLSWPQTINASSGGGQGNPFVDQDFNVLASLPVQVVAGARTYTPTDASTLGVTGSATSMLVADGKLFVVTSQGSIYCFGGAQVTPKTYTVVTTPLPSISDVWTTRVTQMLSGAGKVESCAIVLGIGSGRLVEELVKQTGTQSYQPQIVVVDPDAAKVGALRNKMDAAGLYGTRIAAFVGDPADAGLPPYVGQLIASEDLAAAGYSQGQAFVEKLFRPIRPYGGSAWLPVPADQHDTFAAWVAASGNVPTAEVTRNGDFSVLKRAGAIPGAVNFDANFPSINAPNPDQALKPGPYGVQWYQNAGVGRGHIVNGTIYGGYDAYTGMRISDNSVPSGWQMSDATFNYLPRTNLLTGLPETRDRPAGYGCGRHSDFGALETGRNGCWGWFDKRNESGLVHWTGMRTDCEGGGSAMAGDGVLVAYGPGCSCDYPIRASIGLVSVPEAENWAAWGGQRNQRVVEDAPIKRVGLNFGAPGDRVADDGTVWIESPTQTGPSPLIPAFFTPANPEFYYHHSSRIQDSSDKKWVTASGVSGATAIDIHLAYAAVALAATTPPTIDGQFNDACWDGNKPAVLCFNSDCRVENATNRAFLRYDTDNLYVSLQCLAETWNSGGENLRWGIFLSDRTQVCPDGSGVYTNVHLEVYVDGRKKVNGSDPTNDWTSAWSGVSARDTSTFRCEMAIPWTTLAAAGLDKTQLVFNFHANVDHPYWTSIWFRQGGGTRFCPLYYDAAGGEAGTLRPYKVKMYFAEPDDTAAGARVFDIKLQGQTVASDFDIAQAAGGGRRATTRTFAGIGVKDILKVEFVPKTGVPLISGIEVVQEDGVNHTPQITSALAATPKAACTGEVVQFSVQASDTDLDPLTYSWFFGDGSTSTPQTVSTITHAYTTEGTKSVQVAVSDGKAAVTGTVSVIVLTPSTDGDSDGMADLWEWRNFGGTNKANGGPNDDWDRDGMGNLKEFLAGTNPTNALSVLQISDCRLGTSSKFVITWLSVNGKYYTIEGTTNLLLGFPLLVTNHVPGVPPANSCTVTVDQAAQRFYRVLVEP